MTDVDSRLDRVLNAWDENFRSRGELGASLCLWLNGRELLLQSDGWADETNGAAWTNETLVPIYSAGKGPAAYAVWHSLSSGGLGPEDEVRTIWPALQLSGIKLGELMSHQAGLAALDSPARVENYEEVISALERQTPLWTPPIHGYHPRTFGWICDELVRKASGAVDLGEYWRVAVAEPNELDIWFGLPEAEDARVARIRASRTGPRPNEQDFYRELGRSGSVTSRAFASPKGLHSINEMNKPESRRFGFPGFGALASAGGLGRFYGLLATGGLGEPRIGAWLEKACVNGVDQVLRIPTSFSCGAMKDPVGSDGRKIRSHFGPSLRAFGHPGAGGSHAFCDPEHGFAFAYVMNQFELGVMPGRKALDMVDAWYG